MFAKTLFFYGAVLGLLSFATPALQAAAVEATATPFSSIISPAAVADGERLTLRAALHLGLQSSPELIAANAETQAREAEISQALRFTNPELDVAVANIAGSGAFRGFDAAETTIQLNQQLELGGKRQLRRKMAEVERDRARRNQEIAGIELQARIARHFLTTLAAQERLALAEETIVLAASTLAAVEEKIAVGKAPAVEAYRFQTALAEARLAKVKAAMALLTTQRILIADLGQGVTIAGVTGALNALPLLPAFDELEAQIRQSPDLIRRQLESEVRRRDLMVVRGSRIPDPTISLGLRNFNETDDNAFLFGLSLPLPLFDRNQGKITAAASRLAGAQAEEASALLQSRAHLAAAWQALAQPRAEAQMLRDEIIPSAQQTFELSRYGYQSGKFGVLEVQDAQRTLIEVRVRYLEVLSEAQLAAVELARLLGRPQVSTLDQFVKE